MHLYIMRSDFYFKIKYLIGLPMVLLVCLTVRSREHQSCSPEFLLKNWK